MASGGRLLYIPFLVRVVYRGNAENPATVCHLPPIRVKVAWQNPGLHEMCKPRGINNVSTPISWGSGGGGLGVTRRASAPPPACRRGKVAGEG